VKVTLRNPRREVEVDGPTTVGALLARLEVSPESVLVIVGDELVTHDARLAADAEVEIRPVISGGSDAGSPVAAGDPARARA
jgi:sulfur carrier protein